LQVVFSILMLWEVRRRTLPAVRTHAAGIWRRVTASAVRQVSRQRGGLISLGGQYVSKRRELFTKRRGDIS
jgi:hypothetical protein